jgi:hypothetical protein
MRYKVLTTCTAITEYIVEATSAERAEAKFWDGDTLSETTIDYQNETVTMVAQL